MEEKRRSKRISEILGLSLVFSMLLLWLSALCLSSMKIESENLYLWVRLLLKIPIFGLPVCLAALMLFRSQISMPALSRQFKGVKNLAIAISSVGTIILVQILYSAVFPSAISDMGVGSETSPTGFALMFAIYVILPAVLEELFFRGVVLRALTVFRKFLALLVSALSFALMHFSVERFPIAFFCGLILGIAYLATGSLGWAVLIHLFCNAVWYAAEVLQKLYASGYPTFMQVVFAASVLMIAAGLPMLRATFRMLLAEDEHVAPSSYFWSFPYVVFIITAALAQVVWKG